METLKVVNIGGFGHSEIVFDELKKVPQAQLVALAPAYEQETIENWMQHSIWNEKIEVFSDYKKMLADIQPDVAIIGTRLDKIAEVTIDAARAGCHLIVEKPLALNTQTLKKVHKEVTDSGVKFTAMLTMRSEPQFVTARQIYQRGDIGEAVLINCRKSYKWGKRPEWFGDPNMYGGTIGWVGIHAFDFINYITSLNFTSVAAMKSNFCHHERPACEDNCTIITELSNGAHATVSIDYCRPPSAPTHGDDWIRIVGTKGVLEASGSDQSCKVIVEGKEPYAVPLGEKTKMFKDFLLAVLNNDKYEISPDILFMLTHVCLCAQDAADTNSVVEIEENSWS